MAWKTLVRDDVLDTLSSPELEAYEVAAVQLGQDPVADLLETAINEARGSIADCAENRLAVGLTIPERIEANVLVIVRFRLLTRLDLKVSEARTLEYKQALRFLERVGECKVKIEKPDDGDVDDSDPGMTIETVSSSEREFSRDSMRGLN